MSGRLLRIQEWEELAREAKFRPAVMAALCPVSLRQLERFFLSTFNKTPTQWTRELRCCVARQLISQGWSNKAVVAELHFANESHFCHEFKSVYRVSPQTFAPLYKSTHVTLPPVPNMSCLDKNVALRQFLLLARNGDRVLSKIRKWERSSKPFARKQQR